MPKIGQKSVSYTSQAYFSMKKCPKWWCFFGFFYLNKLATYLKKFRSFGIVLHIEKGYIFKKELY